MKDDSLMTIVLPLVPMSINEVLRRPGRSRYREQKNEWRKLLTVLKSRRKGTDLWFEQASTKPHVPVGLHITVTGWRSRDVDRLCIQPLIDAMTTRRTMWYGKSNRGVTSEEWSGVGILVDDSNDHVRPILTDFLVVPRDVPRRTVVRILRQDVFFRVPELRVSRDLLGIDPWSHVA